MKKITLDSSDIKEIPESIGQLKKSGDIEFALGKQVEKLPDSIGECTALTNMQLTHHPKLKSLPSTLRVLQCAQDVLLSSWDVLSKMSNLEKASISKKNNYKNPDQLAFENGEELDFGWW